MRRVLMLALILVYFAFPAFAQVAPAPSLLNFQGRLTKPDGTPVADGTYSLRFSLWDVATGGTAVSNEKWNQTLSAVNVRNGAFAALLSGFASNLFSNNLWLEIKIGTDAPLTPRQQLVSVAYALKANSVADGSITSASLANGAVTADKLASSALNNLSWLLGGNSGTSPGTHFIGTIDDQSLVFRTNNLERMRLLNNGNLGIGITTPDTPLHVVGPDNNGTQAALKIQSGTQMMLLDGNEIDSTHGLFLNHNLAENVILATGGGNVGVGTTDPLARLHVNGGLHLEGSNEDISIPVGEALKIGYRDPVSNIFTARMMMAPGGYVGIGTQAPSAPLHVVDSATVMLQATSSSPSATGLRLQNTSTGGRTWNLYSIGSSNTVGVGKFTINDGANRFVIDDNGNIGIGLTAPAYALDVQGDINARGKVRANGVELLSDARFKKNITNFPNPLETILSLRGVTYDWDTERWKERGFSNVRQIGFIAQEVEKVLPELVSTDSNGFKSVAYPNVVPVLVEAVKTLKKENDATKRENAELKQRQNVMEAEVAELKALVRQWAEQRR